MASSWAAAAFFAPIHDSDRDRRDSQSDDSTTSRALRLRESAFIRAGVFMPPSSPRIGAGAVTMSACAEFAALVDSLTAPAAAGLRGAGRLAGQGVPRGPLRVGRVVLVPARHPLLALGPHRLDDVVAQLCEPPGDPGPVRAGPLHPDHDAVARVADRRGDPVVPLAVGGVRAGRHDAADEVDHAQRVRVLVGVYPGGDRPSLVHPSPLLGCSATLGRADASLAGAL